MQIISTTIPNIKYLLKFLYMEIGAIKKVQSDRQLLCSSIFTKLTVASPFAIFEILISVSKTR